VNIRGVKFTMLFKKQIYGALIATLWTICNSVPIVTICSKSVAICCCVICLFSLLLFWAWWLSTLRYNLNLEIIMLNNIIENTKWRLVVSHDEQIFDLWLVFLPTMSIKRTIVIHPCDTPSHCCKHLWQVILNSIRPCQRANTFLTNFDSWPSKLI